MNIKDALNTLIGLDNAPDCIPLEFFTNAVLINIHCNKCCPVLEMCTAILL